MKKFLLLLLLILSISCQHIENKQSVAPKKDTIVSAPKIVFVVIGKGIDFDKMEIDTIINKIIHSDSVLELKSISPEIYTKPQIIKAYRVEDITCPYLKERFKKYEPGYVVYQYNDKLLVKAKDGVIKIYHYNLKEIK